MRLRSGHVRLPGAWDAFLQEFDALLTAPVWLHCLGGFVLTAVYGMPRPTGDLDCIAIMARQEPSEILALAGQGSPLHRKHHLHLQYVTVADVPENYESRLKAVLPRRFLRLHLLVLDPYDLLLSKLTRNSPVDREDVKFLMRRAPLDPKVLQERYRRELRPYLSNEARHDLTLALWLDF